MFEEKIDLFEATPDTFEVKLESFEGPLDLLLHLIKKSQMDIYNIQISQITEQYLKIIDQMQTLDLDVAGEFLLMASTLLQIKSKLLLPFGDPDEEDEEDEDPRAELVRRLLEYQRYKEAATELSTMDQVGRDTFLRLLSPDDEIGEQVEVLEEGNVYLLIEAFGRLLKEMPVEVYHEVIQERLSVTERITELVELLRGKESLGFSELFPKERGKPVLIVSFLAVLELVKMKMVRVSQEFRFGEIWLRPVFEDVDKISEVTNEDNLGYQ